MKQTDIERDMRHLELIASRIEHDGVDITADYRDWRNTGFALATLGQQAQPHWHRVCRFYPQYSEEECNRVWQNFLNSTGTGITFATFVQIARDHGVDVSMPAGRPAKTDQQRQEEARGRLEATVNTLLESGEYRHNTWTNRTEICGQDGVWKPIDERIKSTLQMRLMMSGNQMSDTAFNNVLNSSDFAPDFDPMVSWLESLPEWTPAQPDYIHDFFCGHLKFAEPEQVDFYDMVFHKWMAYLVALWTGRVRQNPIMPVLCGSQNIGKSYFVRHILPPQLTDYLCETNNNQRLDKDFIISLSEVPLIFLDEFSFGSEGNSDTFKFILTSEASRERDAYGRNRERRERRAGLIGACNGHRFILDSEGNRRYPGVHIVGTENLNTNPLPYEGAYAQALWMAQERSRYQLTQDEVEQITRHNEGYMVLNNVEAALQHCLRHPYEGGVAKAMTAADIYAYVRSCGFTSSEFSVQSIGKKLKRLGFEKKTIGGIRYYHVALVDPNLKRREQELEASDLFGGN